MPGVNTALSRRRKNLRREFDAIVAGDHAWTEFIPRKAFPERLRSRADETAELREINAHLPFAHGIQPWYPPIDDMNMKLRHLYGSIIVQPATKVFAVEHVL